MSKREDLQDKYRVALVTMEKALADYAIAGGNCESPRDCAAEAVKTRFLKFPRRRS
jgi:hypothetical protein